MHNEEIFGIKEEDKEFYMENDKNNALYTFMKSRENNEKTIYEIKCKEYLQGEFNANHLMLINRLVTESRSISVEIKNTYRLHYIILKVIKDLQQH